MKELKFVIHEHFSKRKHFDFRFQVNDHLESYAIPKGFPIDKEKRLAIFVGERPLSALTFEGTIAEGSYGAGRIVIWDSGIFQPSKCNDQKINFTLEGKRINGRYTMIKLRNKDNWLIFKKA